MNVKEQWLQDQQLNKLFPVVMITGQAAQAIIEAAEINNEKPDKYAEAFIMKADGAGLLKKGIITTEDEEGWV